MALGRLDMVEVAATVYDKMLDGESETDIMSVMRMDAKTFEEVKRFILDSRAEKLRGETREHTFVEYAISQRAIIKQIDGFVAKMDDMKMLGSIVGALRLKSDINERIITRGQEFGIFKKTAERKEIIAGLVVADMSTSDLEKAIKKHHSTFDDMVKKFGDKDFLSLPAKPMHYGTSAFDTEGVAIEEDDEDLLAAPKTKSKSKRSGARSGKHTGYRERAVDSE